MAALLLVARYGRWVLVAGLIAGLVLPDLAAFLSHYIAEMVVLLLFVSVFRMEPSDLRLDWGQIATAGWLVLVLQLALPLVVIALFASFGLLNTPIALALVVMTTAPSIVSSPNLVIMLGHSPSQAMRLLIIGTMILPFSVIPVFALMPQLGGIGPLVTTAARLFVTIVTVTTIATLLRRWLLPQPTQRQIASLDGISTIVVAVFVIGLMTAVSGALEKSLGTLILWIALAFVANLGMQLAAYVLLGSRLKQDTVATAVAAGNRNLALFLVALPEPLIAQILVFVGCYQLPMYLTPLIMPWIYGKPSARKLG